MGGGGHFISYSGRVFTATPDDEMEHVYEENQNETGFEFVHVNDFSDYSLSDGVLSQQFLNLIVRHVNCPFKNVWENHSSIEVAQRK